MCCLTYKEHFRKPHCEELLYSVSNTILAFIVETENDNLHNTRAVMLHWETLTYAGPIWRRAVRIPSMERRC